MGYKVWCDNQACSGCGNCEQDLPQLFFIFGGRKGDGLAYVKSPTDKTGLDSDGIPKHVGENGMVVVPEELLEDCVETVIACPMECLYLEQSDC